MANRYAEDLRRIIGVDEVGNPLGEAILKPKVTGKRSTAYLDAGNGSVQNNTGAKGSSFDGSNAGSSRKGSETTSGGDVPYTGYTSNTGPKASPDYRDEYSLLDQYQYEAEAGELLDNTKGPGVDTNETIDKLTAIDPDTGVQIDILFGDNGYDTPDGWNFWDDSGAGPDPTFYAGYYYDSVTAGHVPTQTATEQVDKMIANYEASGSFSEIIFLGYDPEIPPPPATGFFITTARFRLIGLAPNFSETLAGQGIHRFACSGADPSGSGDYCSTEAPLTGPQLTEWPSDGKIAFLAKEGFKPSSYESASDLEGFVQGGTGKLKINFGELGEKVGEVARAKDGSILLYETVAGDPFGSFKKYDTQGKLIEVGDVSELPQHLPNND